MNIISYVKGILWRIFDVILRYPLWIITLVGLLIFFFLWINYSYLFFGEVYESKEVLNDQNLSIEVQYPNYIKSGGDPIDIYISATSNTNVSGTLTIQTSDPLAKITPNSLHFDIASNVPSNSIIHLQYLPNNPFHSSNNIILEFIFLDDDKSVNVRGEPIRIAVDSISLRVVTVMLGFGTLISFILTIIKSIRK